MKPCPHCGGDTAEPRKGKPRSVPQHRRYFALIRGAYHHWPESHDFRPHSEGHLRRWLQCKAGYYTVRTINVADLDPTSAVAAAAAAMAEAGEHAFVRGKGTRLYVFASRSINFDTLPHLAACALFDAVAEVIAAETGLELAQIMPPIATRRRPLERARDQLTEAVL